MKTSTTALLLATALLLSAPVRADDDDLPKMRAIAAAMKLISLEDATAKALAAKPGTVIEADLDRRMLGGYDYEFEIIDADGQNWDVHIDARDGKVRSVRRDWFD
ncbi:PepSY domain-containing protein [Methyloversatilis universalis]|uniref:PepSY domain-containing protein n=1 Tax=Methyloversatilis universalis TaxID=378211 RepID=UPI00036DF01A|nr:PepSY domain-containing protein [Methyloversatilis universalis]